MTESAPRSSETDFLVARRLLIPFLITARFQVLTIMELIVRSES
jgi:hypothetical protein